jgi:hypothetical protein
LNFEINDSYYPKCIPLTDPQRPKKFKTLWGKGYFFVSDAWSSDNQHKDSSNDVTEKD